jgi:hypothetical protein
MHTRTGVKTHAHKKKHLRPSPAPAKPVTPQQDEAATPDGAPRLPPFELTEQSFRLGKRGEKDDLAEELGEAYVQSMTSGAQAAEEFRDEDVPEDRGGPFVVTSAETEFAAGVDASNPADAERAPFPVVSSQPTRQ